MNYKQMCCSGVSTHLDIDTKAPVTPQREQLGPNLSGLRHSGSDYLIENGAEPHTCGAAGGGCSQPGWPGGGSEVQQLISAERNY